MPQGDAERVVCADAILSQLNSKLAERFHADFDRVPHVLHAMPGSDPVHWKRRLCGTDTACLAAQYRESLAGYEQPDASEVDAVESFRKLVDGLRTAHPQDAVGAAYKLIAVSNRITTFASEIGEIGTQALGGLPSGRPDGVSEDEWRALLASSLAEASEHGIVPTPLLYTLLDIDGDGNRDLVIDSERQYEAGRLYAFRTLRRTGTRFIPFNITGNVVATATGAGDPVYLPDEPGFGILQGKWVSLNNRLFRFYANSDRGIDEIYLLRPGRRLSKVPRLTVDYLHRLKLVSEAAISPQRRLSVDEALAEVYTAKIRSAYTAPLCAAPDDILGDANRSYSPPNLWSMSTVGDFPVKLAGVCYISQLRNESNIAGAMQWCMRLPSDPRGEQEECYDVHGPRNAVATLIELVPLLP